MYALVGIWTCAQGRTAGGHSLRDLDPSISQIAGFVKSFWAADPETGKIHSFDVYWDEEGARRLKAVIEAGSPIQARSGLSYDRLSVVVVKAWTQRAELQSSREEARS